MPDCYLVSLAKVRKTSKFEDLAKFLKSWYSNDKYTNEIFQYLKMNCLPLDTDVKVLLQLLSKAE